MTIKLSLIDNDYVIQTNTNLELKDKEEQLKKFFSDISDELITGKVAFLEIDSPGSEILTLEVSKCN